METNLAFIDKSGRILIPAKIRSDLGLRAGDQLILVRDGDEIRLISRASAITRAQHIVRSHVPAGVSLVAELLAEREGEDRG